MNGPVSCAVVIPIYEDVEASAHLFCELRQVLGSDVFVVAVDDGSVKQPLPASGISEAGLNGVVLRLKRNTGHQRAISVGVAYVADRLPGMRCVVMDADGEDLPATVQALLNCLDEEIVNVAVG